MARKYWKDMRVEEKLEELRGGLLQQKDAIFALLDALKFPDNHPSMLAIGRAIDELSDNVSDLRRTVLRLDS